MIYEFPDTTAPIRQGDIFVGLPRIDLSLREVPIIVEESQLEVQTWRTIAEGGQPVKAVLALRPVAAIVATQDCDTVHGRDITLCEIREFRDIERKAKDTKAPKGWKDIITQ